MRAPVEEKVTSVQIAELRESVRREALPIWATTNGNTETWVTTPGIGLRATRALRALPKLLDEREALLGACRAMLASAAEMAAPIGPEHMGRAWYFRRQE